MSTLTLTRSERQGWIAKAERSGRGVFEAVQKGNSLQNTYTPASLTFNLLGRIPSLDRKDILVVANVEVYNLFVNLQKAGKINPKSLTFLTDIESLRGKDNVIVVDFNKIDKIKLDMKYDVAIGNPPYNAMSVRKGDNGNHKSGGRKLHVDFINWGLDHATEAIWICPVIQWWSGGKSKVAKRIHEEGVLASYTHIDEKAANKVFNATVGNLAIFHLAKGDSPTKVISFGSEKVLQEVERGKPFLCVDNEVSSLIEKVQTGDTFLSDMNVTRGPNRSAAENLAIDGGSVLYLPIVGKQGEAPNILTCSEDLLDESGSAYFNKALYKMNHFREFPRVVINLAGTSRKLSALKVIDQGVVISRNVTSIAAQSVEECNNLLTYLQSSLVSFIVYHSHLGKNNTKQTFKYVPKVDLTRSWTDKELYKHFNLTQEEINLIESTVK